MAHVQTTRDRLIDAAWELARQKGFDRTSVSFPRYSKRIGRRGSLAAVSGATQPWR